eukprot:TRINITY_DN3760_c0_g1_i1.p1 TRINITY_DN3760_c0_g1~~TRINITY_DN3760_c0_g1_i1.p1  ORF type:complete len:564 (+),score=67.32 TRINITY_DN3760_c0_g1_i1:145-1836(+)
MLRGNGRGSSNQQQQHYQLVGVGGGSSCLQESESSSSRTTPTDATLTDHVAKVKYKVGKVGALAICDTGRAKCVAFHPRAADMHLMLASLYSGKVQLWDMDSSTCIAEYTAHTGPSRAVCFFGANSTETVLATGGDDCCIRLWDYSTHTPLAPTFHCQDYIRSLMFHPVNPDLILSGSDDHLARLWNWRTGTCLSYVTASHYVMQAVFNSAIPSLRPPTHQQSPEAKQKKREVEVKEAEEEIVIAVASLERKAFVHRLEQPGYRPSAVAEYSAGHGVNSVAFNATGELLAYSSDDTFVYIVDIRKDAYTGTNVDEVASRVKRIDLEQGESTATSATGSLIRSSPPGVPLRLVGHRKGVSSVVFHPTIPELCISGAEDGIIRVWNVTSGHAQSYRLRNGRVWYVAAHPHRPDTFAAADDCGFFSFTVTSVDKCSLQGVPSPVTVSHPHATAAQHLPVIGTPLYSAAAGRWLHRLFCLVGVLISAASCAYIFPQLPYDPAAQCGSEWTPFTMIGVLVCALGWSGLAVVALFGAELGAQRLYTRLVRYRTTRAAQLRESQDNAGYF